MSDDLLIVFECENCGCQYFLIHADSSDIICVDCGFPVLNIKWGFTEHEEEYMNEG